MKSRIKEWIAKSPYNQTQVAKMMEVSNETLSKWVNNKNKPSLEKAFKLATILNCKVDDLYEYHEDYV